MPNKYGQNEKIICTIRHQSVKNLLSHDNKDIFWYDNVIINFIVNEIIKFYMK
jgi:hypothetical protein